MYNIMTTYYTHQQVYDGPTSTKLDSKPRHYATGYPEPKTRTGDDAIGKIKFHIIMANPIWVVSNY